MQNLKTVDFGVAFTLTRPAPADYEDKDGNTQTAAANEPRFNYSNGVAQGLMLDASLNETAAIDDVPAFNASAGHWIIDAEFYNSEPLKGMGLNGVFTGSGKMVVSYSGGTAKVWAGGQVIYTVGSYTPVEPTHICEGGMVTMAGLTYKPSAISDADAAALATGDFEIYVPFSPSQLFSEGQQGAWYDPSDLATLFQDAAGTIPVTSDGDPVGYVRDLSGNGNHATQSVSASRPIYRTDGTLHWLEFDGVDDALVTSQSLALRSYFGAARANGNNQSIFAYNVANTQYISGVSGGLIYCLVGGSASYWTTTPYTYGQDFIQSAFVGTGINQAWFDGSAFNTPATASTTEIISTHTIGVREYSSASAPSWYLGGRVYGIIFTDSEAVLSSDRANVEQYLSAKSGVQL